MILLFNFIYQVPEKTNTNQTNRRKIDKSYETKGKSKMPLNRMSIVTDVMCNRLGCVNDEQ